MSTVHPVVAEHPGWVALDDEHRRLMETHRAVIDRLEKEQARAQRVRTDHEEAVADALRRGKPLPSAPGAFIELGGHLTSARMAEHADKQTIRVRRRDWMRDHAEHLTGLLRERERDLLAEAAQYVEGFTASKGEQVRGLAAVRDEAQSLRDTYLEVQRVARPHDVPSGYEHLTIGGLLDVALHGALLVLPQPEDRVHNAVTYG